MTNDGSKIVGIPGLGLVMSEVSALAFHPTCVVLLATYNGARWLPEQLRSIYGQLGVTVKIFAGDDQSTDSTRSVLEQWATSHGLEISQGNGERLGSANKNFLRLIRDVDIGSADYIALADQDDIWHSDKLARAVGRLEATGADAYSSDVEAFWPDGRSQIVRKSQPQKAWDYLFSSPGPGCTFVFRRKIFLDLKVWVSRNFEALSNLWVHDWTLYAYVRSSGRTWLIDDYASMRYRQHEQNEVGANIGLSALVNRFVRMRSGEYRANALAISRLAGAPPRLLRALERMSVIDRFWLASNAHHFRRRFKEIPVMIFLVMFMK